MPTPVKEDCNNKVKRDVQVSIFCLRSQHIQLDKHLEYIKVRQDAQCPLCQCPEETVAHHLFECTALDDLRVSLLPERPNLTNTLMERLNNWLSHISYISFISWHKVKGLLPSDCLI